MRWLKRERWKASIALAGLLLLLILMVWLPMSSAGASGRASGLATPGTGTVQATSTIDATVTVLDKDKLAQEVQQLKEQNDATIIASNKEKLRHENDWWWNYGATILTSLISTLALAAAGVFTVIRYFNDRRDTREKQEAEAKHLAEDRKIERERRDEEQQRWLKDQEAEREKRAEERFQAVVEGLGSERNEAKIGAAITLRTFLHPGYEQFYTQAFDLAVAHLRLPGTPSPSEDPEGISQSPVDPATPLPLTTLRQALIMVFKEAFPLARSQMKKSPESLDASRIQLDHAYLADADLAEAWLERASLREADLFKAQLEGAHLYSAQLEGAKLRSVQLKGANLYGAQLEGADLYKAQLEGANLYKAQLKGADLSGANPEDAASLKGTKMNGVRGLTPEQREKCIKKGAIFDDVEQASDSDTSSSTSLPPAQSNSAQGPSASLAQVNASTPGTDGNAAASSQPGPES